MRKIFFSNIKSIWGTSNTEPEDNDKLQSQIMQEPETSTSIEQRDNKLNSIEDIRTATCTNSDKLKMCLLHSATNLAENHNLQTGHAYISEKKTRPNSTNTLCFHNKISTRAVFSHAHGKTGTKSKHRKTYSFPILLNKQHSQSVKSNEKQPTSSIYKPKEIYGQNENLANRNNAQPTNHDDPNGNSNDNIVPSININTFHALLMTPTNVRKHPFRILTIDGGGVRGILPAVILQHIEQITGKQVHELFDLIVGTSTGALLGTLLVLPEYKGGSIAKHSAEDAVQLYMKQSSEIFHRSLLRRFKSLAGLLTNRYSSRHKRIILEQYFQDYRITDALTDILVPSFDLREGKPYFFKSTKARTHPMFNHRLVEVLDATSSAPTYFPPCKVQNYDAPKSNGGYRSFVDGALVSNSPALCGLAEAMRYYDADPKETVIISLGCGASNLNFDHDKSKNWGGVQWARNFPKLLLNSSMYTVDYQLNLLVPPANYFRFQTTIPPERSDIDNVNEDNLNWLAAHSQRAVTQMATRLDEAVKLLVDPAAGISAEQ